MRSLRAPAIHPDLLFGLVLSAWLLLVGFAESIPGATFILQAGGLGTLLGTGFALWRRRREPSYEMAVPIAAFTLAAALAATVAQLIALLAG